MCKRAAPSRPFLPRSLVAAKSLWTQARALGGPAILACLLAGCPSAGTIDPGGLVTDGRSTAAGESAPAGSMPIGLGSTSPNATPGSANGLVAGNANGGMPSNANAAVGRSKAPGVAMYYGTGNYQGVDPALSTLCQDGDISIIILSFIDTIASKSTNQNGNPHMSINNCPIPYDGQNPRLGRCPALGTAIAACQAAGKQVILSIGGGGANVSFVSDAEATAYASLMWNMFLGGNGSIRPFGTAVLDGIDLDVENGPTTGYAAFVLALRKLMLTDASKPYLITAAPQCPFRDAWMGPDGLSHANQPLQGTALTLALTAFDHLFIQFYNNYCAFSSPQDFATTWKQWTTLGPVQPKIWVGLPAAIDAADTAGFVQPANLSKIVAAVGGSPLFGGFMFWDAGYDADNIAKGQRPMRAVAADALKAIAVP